MSLMQYFPRSLWLLFGLALILEPAHALKFASLDQGSVLLIYDCGNGSIRGEAADKCAPHEKNFSGEAISKGVRYAGDAAYLEGLLQAGSYSKIFLNSGGGNLAEGLKLGRVLRKYNQYVVVPDGASCVSACTLAFLGGRIREVRPRGDYRVHAYSRFLEINEKAVEELRSGKDLEEILSSVASAQASDSRSWAVRLFVYVQEMIGGGPNLALVERIASKSPDYRSEYKLLASDAGRIRVEGVSTAQDILMRMERDAFRLQMDHLRKNEAQLGVRAKDALDILEIMFSSRITSTASLDQTTLKEKGYTNVRN